MAWERRKNTDVMNLIKSQHEVTFISLNNFDVKFHGPVDTPYHGGVWNIRVHLPDDYPFKSPSIGFTNPIYHPNIDHRSGSVCLDVINQTWTPLYDLKNIFESFLPQLLAYPNVNDPLNPEAAVMYIHKPKEFLQKVVENMKENEVGAQMVKLEDDGDLSEDSSMSDYSDEEKK